MAQPSPPPATAAAAPPPPPLRLQHLATISPPAPSRAWQTRPHPTQPLLATACADRTARVSSLVDFSQRAVVGGGHKRSVRSVAWRPGAGDVLCTGSFDASAGIWRRREETEVDMTGGDKEEEEWTFAVVLDGHDSEVKSVAYGGAGLLATCGRDKSVWIWEEVGADEYETVAVLQEHEGDVKSVAWHPEEALVASGSYDDTVRLWREEADGEDWGCAAVLEGFGGTVWGVEFEPTENVGRRAGGGPRLLTCCDDRSVRVWRRVEKEGGARRRAAAGGPKMPSILRTTSIEEEWVEDARLPEAHERAVYATGWSAETGRVVSCGGDGRIVVYEERGGAGEWAVVAVAENGHDVFEINHVTWAKRADKGRTREGEEVVVSTGDDGEVKVWTLE